VRWCCHMGSGPETTSEPYTITSEKSKKRYGMSALRTRQAEQGDQQGPGNDMGQDWKCSICRQ
jgi:hypothetical protein